VAVRDPMSNPPFYVLVAHSNAPDGALSNTLGHPVIQYHYADDSPLSLLPSHPDEHVLVLNYDHNIQPTVQSLSKNLSVMGLRLEEAPGAAASDESRSTNSTMFIIETTSHDQYISNSLNANASLHSFAVPWLHHTGTVNLLRVYWHNSNSSIWYSFIIPLLECSYLLNLETTLCTRLSNIQMRTL